MLLKPAQLLLPRSEYLSIWPCVACDQFTSEPEYWRKMDRFVGDAPSALHYILPECDLSSSDVRIPEIWHRMQSDLKADILDEAVPMGYVITERHTQSGIGLGLTGVIDLEEYDYHPGNRARLRASEATVESRLPIRKAIRAGAALETSHVLILINDPAQQVLEPLFEKRSTLPVLYDLQLPGEGGLLRGYAVTDASDIRELSERYAAYAEALTQEIPEAVVGDGNHSLASAKSYWEELKLSLPQSERLNHPARFAMVELKNIQQESLLFAPIHRIIFGARSSELNEAFSLWLQQHEAGLCRDDAPLSADIQTIQSITDGEKTELRICNPPHPLAVGTLQLFLDDLLKEHDELRIDYIHGERALESLAKGNACGYLVPVPSKSSLFETVAQKGVLPRKTFSLGEANEKRYYMECRKIVK